METYSYEYAIEKYKLALVSTIAKKGKLSEKAYICLNIAWLLRGQIEQLLAEEKDNQELIDTCKKEYDGFYRQAFDGFIKVTSTETPPYCGMDANTLDYIDANMAVYFKEYEIASKLVSRLLGSPSVNRRMKDCCLEMKDEIIANLRSN